MLGFMRIPWLKDRSETGDDGRAPPAADELELAHRADDPERGDWRDELDELRELVAGQVVELESRIDRRVKELTIAIEEGIERVDRSERRVKAVVQRAQRRASEHGFVDETLEVEAENLRRDDEGGSGSGGMQTVLEDVVDRPRFDAQGIPGTITDQMIRELGI